MSSRAVAILIIGICERQDGPDRWSDLATRVEVVAEHQFEAELDTGLARRLVGENSLQA